MLAALADLNREDARTQSFAKRRERTQIIMMVMIDYDFGFRVAVMLRHLQRSALIIIIR